MGISLMERNLAASKRDLPTEITVYECEISKTCELDAPPAAAQGRSLSIALDLVKKPHLARRCSLARRCPMP